MPKESRTEEACAGLPNEQAGATGPAATLLAILLGLMVLVTFTNVILRYLFNDSLIWGLELTLVLFAWMVLLGISHGFKACAHLGVDVLMTRLKPARRKWLLLFSALVCLAYACLLAKGAWDYWAPFAGLERSIGRWLPLGFDAATRDFGWYETDQLPMPDFLRFLEPLVNSGEPYEKLPRFIPYAALPVGSALLLVWCASAVAGLLRGKPVRMIAMHGRDSDEPNGP